jgi:hypothetical protein
MKKLITFFLVIFCLVSCSEEEQLPQAENVADFTINQIDTFAVDTTDYLLKAETLIKSTEHADRKVGEIKTMKTNNAKLKKELKVTKEELKIAKEQVKALDSALKVNEEKGRKGLIKRVIDNIKGGNDTIK